MSMDNICALGVWDSGSSRGILIQIGLWCNTVNMPGFGPGALSSNLGNPILESNDSNDNKKVMNVDKY